MNKIEFLLVAAAISSVPLLNCCVKDPPPVVEEPEPDLTETILRFLKNIDTYDIGEHSCTVETSADSYEYPLTLVDTPYSCPPSDNNKVPMGLVDTMSTLGLMETILENPNWYSIMWWGENCIYRFLSIDDYISFCSYERSNPGLLQKFYDRDDATGTLVERYTNMYPTCLENNYSSGYGKGGFPDDSLYFQISTAFMNIQILMAEDPILTQLTEEELREVSVHVVKNYISLMENTGTDCLFYNMRAMAWLATRIMETNDYRPFYQLYGEYAIRTAFAKLFYVSNENYAKLMLCLNNFIQEEL